MTTKTRSTAPTPAQLAFREDLVAVMRKHGDHLRADELLAVAAHMVGQMIAMQDQRTFTSATVMKLVADNIEAGNREVVDSLVHAAKGRA